MGASSTTRRRPVNQKLKQRATAQAAAEVMTQVMMGLLEHWSKEELVRLSASGRVYCMRTGRDSFQIGNYDLHRRNDMWHVDARTSSETLDFFNKQAAVLYCFYSSRNKYHTARELMLDDKSFGLLQRELELLYEHLKRAVERKDSWKQDLYLARLSWTRPMLEVARDNLQKKINSAKYTKVWETKHETARDRH